MTAQNKRQRVAYVILLCFIAIAIVISGWIIPTAYADVDLSSAYDKTNAYDDLKGSTIGGEPFKLSDYPKAEKGTPSIIMLTEYCYSTLAQKQAYFGLYVYVYNPSEKSIDENSARNKVSIKIGTGEYRNYMLDFLNYSTDTACKKRFYKFRVSMSYSTKQRVLAQLKSAERVYEVVGVELSYSGSVTDYECAKTFTYSGYGQGCNPDGSEESTLTFSIDGFDKYLNLNVKHTEYRAKGDYYKGEQSQLNSVYFRVPNRYFENYGELTEIACEWFEYFTKPLLVSNDSRAVSAINSLYGRNTLELSKDYYYLFMTFWEGITSSWFAGRHRPLVWTSNRDYSKDWYSFGFLWLDDKVDFSDEQQMDGFAAAFYTDKLNSIDNTLTGDVVLERLREHSYKLGGEKVRDKYSKALFEDYVQNGYDLGYNRRAVKPDDQMEIFWNNITTYSLWTKMFGISFNDAEYKALNAIITVEDTDVKGSDSEIAERLYIGKNDVSTFKDEYNKAKEKEETLVLFRFSTTKYMCAPAVTANCKGSEINSGTSNGEILVNSCYQKYSDKAWNAYTVQETVYLDFDIISLTYTLDNVETVIPVVASPIDIAGRLDPPLDDPTSKGGGRDWERIIQIVLGIIIGLLILWLLNKLGLLPLIGKVIAAPFVALAGLFKRRKKAPDSPPNVTVQITNTDKNTSEDKK